MTQIATQLGTKADKDANKGKTGRSSIMPLARQINRLPRWAKLTGGIAILAGAGSGVIDWEKLISMFARLLGPGG